MKKISIIGGIVVGSIIIGIISFYLYGIFQIGKSIVVGRSAVCYFPKNCLEIKSSEYSTGGGKKLFQIVEILCKTKEGYSTYVDYIVTPAASLGAGRLAMLDKIKFIKRTDNKDKMTCK